MAPSPDPEVKYVDRQTAITADGIWNWPVPYNFLAVLARKCTAYGKRELGIRIGYKKQDIVLYLNSKKAPLTVFTNHVHSAKDVPSE